jgi:hypothetical protein
VRGACLRREPLVNVLVGDGGAAKLDDDYAPESQLIFV